MNERNPPDLALMTVVLIFLGIGLMTVYSASAIYAFDRFGNENISCGAN